MKRLLVILCFPLWAFTQELPDTCFTAEQIQDISFTLDSLYQIDDINKAIIEEQEIVIAGLMHVIRLDSMEINYRRQQTELLQRNINLYVEREKYIKPKWFDNKAIWFGAGILTTAATIHLAIQIIK
jgi:hypothetical protein